MSKKKKIVLTSICTIISIIAIYFFIYYIIKIDKVKNQYVLMLKNETSDSGHYLIYVKMLIQDWILLFFFLIILAHEILILISIWKNELVVAKTNIKYSYQEYKEKKGLKKEIKTEKKKNKLKEKLNKLKE